MEILNIIAVASTMIVYTFAMTLFAKDIAAWSTEELKRKLDDTEYVLANREDYILKLEEFFNN